MAKEMNFTLGGPVYTEIFLIPKSQDNKNDTNN